MKYRIASIGIFQFKRFYAVLKYPSMHGHRRTTLSRSFVLSLLLLNFVCVLSQTPHISVGVGGTPMALSGDYRALGWNPAHLTLSPMNEQDWKSAIAGLEGSISVTSTVLQREDLWDDILNRGISNESWTGLTPSEWVNRLANEEISVDVNFMTTGIAKHWKNWGVAYSSRNVFFAESYLSPSMTSLLIEGGSSSLFNYTIIGSDTVPNNGNWNIADLVNIIGGLNSNNETLLSSIFQDSKLSMSWHRSHELGISKQWSTKRGWAIHTGVGGRFLLGNGFLSLTGDSDEMDAFGAFSNGFQIERFDSITYNNPTFMQLRNWGPVGQGWGIDLGVSIAFTNKIWASASITDIGWMEWRGERYNLNDAMSNTWNNATSSPNQWIDIMELALNPETWFSSGVSEIRRVKNGVGFHVGGGIRLVQGLVIAGDASFDNRELIGNDGTRFGLSGILQPIPWLRIESGLRKIGKETIRVPMGFIFMSGNKGFEFGLQSSDIAGLWRKSQSELGVRFCFLRWVW